MPDWIAPYSVSVTALGVYGFLHLAQLLVADVIGIVRRHTPGTPVVGDHDDLLFRASRAHANTTESVGAVILIAFFAIATGASPGVSNSLLAGFVACRVVHMIAYYSDLRVLRSVAFGLGVLALLGLLGAGVAARFG